MKMIEHSSLERLGEEIKQIIQSELTVENVIKEAFPGGFSEASDDHIFVFLKIPFRKKYNISGIQFREIDDYQYWKAEYNDDINHQTIACNF